MRYGTAEINGTTIYHETNGKGPPVVLVSGGALLDRRGWDKQFEALAGHFEVIRYDIRGIGQSARPLGPFCHAEDLRSLLEFLDVERSHIIGLSFGGVIALDFALDHPEMVEKLILVSSGTSSDAKAEGNMQSLAALSSMVKQQGMDRVVQLILDSGAIVARDNTAAGERIREIYQDNRDVFESDFPLIRLWQPAEPPASERLSEVRARTMVMMGENDNPAYKAIAEKLALSLPGAESVTVAGAAHVINLDQSEDFNRLVLAFLS
jgi:pimeloyl-ACP methyl ester carboxylesterase